MDKISLRYNTLFLDIDIDPPLFGYTSNITLPFEINQLESGSYSFYDESSIPEKRECICDFELTKQESASLNEFISTVRGEIVELILVNNSGFFPAGPDKGDSGTFTCLIDSVKHNGMQNEPFRYFGDKIILRFIDYPEYELPEQIPDGSFAIGNISDLRFPEQMFDVNQLYAYTSNQTENNTPKNIDRGNLADSYETIFVMRSTQNKAAHLIDALVNTIRINQTTITAQNQHFPFGINKNDNQIFDAFFLQDKISIKHSKFNEFEFQLNFMLEQHITAGNSFFYVLPNGLLALDAGVQSWQ
jgi:hypothetical protein